MPFLALELEEGLMKLQNCVVGKNVLDFVITKLLNTVCIYIAY